MERIPENAIMIDGADRLPIKKLVDIELGFNGKNVKASLEDTRDSYHCLSKKHKKHEFVFKVIDRVLTYPQLILSIIITFLSGLDSFGEQESSISKTIFALSLCGSILSASTTFFNFNTKSMNHHLISQQYENLYISLRAWLLWTRTREELKSKLQEMKTTEIVITDYEPTLYT